MKWRGLLGVVVLFAGVSCGTESARSPDPSPADSAVSSARAADTGATESAAAPPAPAASAAGAAATVAAASAPEPDQKAPAGDAKPSAPVTIKATLRTGAADLDVTFGTDGSNVQIKVWGVDGLKVTKGATPVALAAVKSGQSVNVAVQYEAPTTESNLAVSVSGTFNGREQVKVQSFTINAGNPKPSAPAGESTTDKDGRHVKVIKSR